MNEAARVLIVEDDSDLREAVSDTLEIANIPFRMAEHGEDALRALHQAPASLVISDVNMPGMDGHELMGAIHAQFPGTPVALMTAYGTIERAVDAMHSGAVDYLVKPFASEELVALIRRFISAGDGANDSVGHGADAPIAEEASSRELLSLAERVAQTPSTVLISGESGTGKEVLARYIHDCSPRAGGPFVAINCAAIPENMLEATLFGHEKGAYTGAYNSAPGKFELADGGTLLLDEISEMDIGLQAKLLRVLQEREVERVGARKPVAVDVRVIATTNRDLRIEVQDGNFREDLYYRLSVFPLAWQPLRERPADILPLARRLLHLHAGKMGLPVPEFSPMAEESLLSHEWPGNVRELDNALQRSLILSGGSVIEPEHLRIEQASMADSVQPTVTPGHALESNLRDREFSLIVDAIRGEHGSRKQAAERLGLSPRTLRYKIQRFREEGLDIDSALQTA